MRFRSSLLLGTRRAVVASLSLALVCAGSPVSAYADTQSDLAAARAQLEQIGNEYAAISDEIDKLGADLQETSRQIEKTTDKIDVAQSELANYTSNGYKDGGVTLTRVFFNATNLSDLLSGLFYMTKVSDAQVHLIKEVEDLQADLEEQQATQQEAMEDAEARLAEQAENQARAAALVDSLDARVRAELEAEAANNASIQQGMESAAGGRDDGSVQRPEEPNGGNSGNTGNSGSSNGSGSNNGSGSGSNNGSTGGSNGGSSTVGSAALSIALQFEGSPYVYGGASPSTGFDCSGLTMYAYAQLGISLPHSAGGQMSLLQRSGRFTTNINELQYGDLVFFPGHVAFYVGGGMCYGARRPGVPASSCPMSAFGTFLGGGNF